MRWRDGIDSIVLGATWLDLEVARREPVDAAVRTKTTLPLLLRLYEDRGVGRRRQRLFGHAILGVLASELDQIWFSLSVKRKNSVLLFTLPVVFAREEEEYLGRVLRGNGVKFSGLDKGMGFGLKWAGK